MNVKPIAFVDEHGFIVPTPVFNEESKKHIRGRYIYTTKELDIAIRECNELQEERRKLADIHLGSGAVRADMSPGDTAQSTAHEVLGERETVPGFNAPPTKGSKRGGVNKAVQLPNVVETPETLDAKQKPTGGSLNINEAISNAFGGK